jgi:hypothetical protein
MKCEFCLNSGKIDPDDALEAVEKVWMHRPFSTPDCRWVHLCQECMDQGAEDEVDEKCPCGHDYKEEGP